MKWEDLRGMSEMLSELRDTKTRFEDLKLDPKISLMSAFYGQKPP